MWSARGAERSPTHAGMHAGEPSGPAPAVERARLTPNGASKLSLYMSHRRLRRGVRTSPVLGSAAPNGAPSVPPASRMLPPRTAPFGRSDRDRFKGTFGEQAWPNKAALASFTPSNCPHEHDSVMCPRRPFLGVFRASTHARWCLLCRLQAHGSSLQLVLSGAGFRAATVGNGRIPAVTPPVGFGEETP